MRGREKKLIDSAISKLQLDLSNLVVLTEVGSNNYLYTPIIAAIAGAKKVFAWTKDSRFGTGKSIVNECVEVCKEFGLPTDQIEFSVNERPSQHVLGTDIITNLGFVRPLNKELLQSAKSKVVIPYMCEAWEFREGDVDIEYCKQNSIKVAGTWENHPSLKIFDGCEHLIAKLCFEAGFEIYQNKILVISQDDFGQLAQSIFIKLKCDTVKVIPPALFSVTEIENYDFIFLADYLTDYNVFSEDFLKNNNLTNVSIVHLCGTLDLDLLERHDFKIFPQQNGIARRMSRALDYLGPKPVIDLHTAGLKVAECLHKGLHSELIQPII